MTEPWTQNVIDRRLSGTLRVHMMSPQGGPVDVTYYRGIPTQVTNFTLQDPFGPSTAEISFPQLSAFDNPHSPELTWISAGANLDLYWLDYQKAEAAFQAALAENPTADDALQAQMRAKAESISLVKLWEGYVASAAYNQTEDDSTISLQCKGALFQADNYLAYPQFPPTPIPYELLIRDGLNPVTHPTLRTTGVKITFPPGWTTKVPNLSTTPGYLKPWGVKQGDNWTGLTTRSTGSWNKMLTGQIQALLSLMYAADGSQWTLMLNTGRIPELRLRPYHRSPQRDSLEVTVAQPGVAINLTEDWTAAANVYYGQGTDISGTAFSNSVVSNDGSRTSYAPFAAMRQVHPPTSTGNRWFDHTVMRQETYVQFDEGLSAAAATALAQSQLARTASPGFQGTVTLTIDPARYDYVTDTRTTVSRFLITPGMTLLINGFQGKTAPLLVHIAQVSVSPMDASVELTVDSKFRDYLTVSQVRARTRDKLATIRSLKVGAYTTQIQDQRKPWSYSAGSGIIPSAPAGKGPNGRDLFMRYATGSDVFPWTTLTRRFPPKSHSGYYITIGNPGPSSNYTKNWSALKDTYAVPVLMAEQGNIRLTQVAAYDRDGNVMPIRFHISFYYEAGVNATSMPMIPGPGIPGYLASLRNHVSQHYPFFPGAFEKYDPNLAPKPAGDFTVGQADVKIGWGNYYQGAGYWPSMQTDQSGTTNSVVGGVPIVGHPTGMMVDETSWDFNTSTDQNFQQRPTKNFPQNSTAGIMFVMIYAEALHLNQPVYFLGRCFRQEPGTT
jgi:hypothetical protein